MSVEAGEVVDGGRSHIIKRPRLTCLLDGTRAEIIVLIAPAGYGKTTLAREWLHERPHAWYRGNSATSDVAALALGISRAASTLVPGAGERLAKRLRVSQAPSDDVEALADLLADDLQGWPPDAWLVFDDYHFACDSAPAERFVEHLAFSSPLRLLVAGRSRPSWATARRVLYGEILEVGRNLLAMNQAEAQAVLARRDETETDGLIALADGWPALLGIEALAHESGSPRLGLPDEVYNYLAEELYQSLSEEDRQGLRCLSLSPVVTPGTADALLGARAPGVLSRAYAAGFFLQYTSDRLSFHPLLGAFLSSKFDPDRDDPDGTLLACLVRILLEHEDWDSAFELIERFFSEDLLVSLFEAALPRMVDEARLPTLTRWIAASNAHAFDSPIVDLADAEVSLKQGHLRRAEGLALQAERRLSADHPFVSKALWIAGMSAHLTAREQVAFKYFLKAEQLARSTSDRNQALWGQFSAKNRLDELEDARCLLDGLHGNCDNTPDQLLRLGTGQLMLASLTGDLSSVLDSVELLSSLLSRARDAWILSSFLNVYAALLVLGGQYEAALMAAKEEAVIASTYGLDFAIQHANFHIATALLGLREFRACSRAVRACEKSCRATGDHFLRMNVGILYGRIDMMTGSAPEALKTFEHYFYPPSTQAMQAEYLAWWSLAHAVEGHHEQAEALANRARNMSARIEVAALVPWTKAILLLDKRSDSSKIVDEPFARSVASGNYDALVTAYRARPELLECLMMDQSKHDTLRVVLERAHDFKFAQTVGLRLASQPTNTSVADLTNREREVVELVCQGMTNKEIGRTLYIEETTVKAHLRNTCRKLGVRTRTEVAMRFSEISG